MEPQSPPLNPKLRLLCSYGGRITPIPPSNSLDYIGGDTRIVAVPRVISFTAFFQLLSGKLLSGRSFSLKYRLPGYDLDSLITVTNNEDLQNMIAEYDSASPQRIRLFLFPFESSTGYPLSANLLGLESPMQKIVYTSSYSSIAPFPIFPQTSLNTAADAGVSDKETERVEFQDQPRRIVVQQQQQHQYLPIIYLPVLPMQPHMVTRSVNGYALSPAVEYSSGADPVLENKETTT
ncbi:Octicosapeptide/Phox/Bem1p family protein [Hirschfeldia incana]|nr:Octicosapeptide/Phox/Bem1p family protein [Hirschfeldia incana]